MVRDISSILAAMDIMHIRPASEHDLPSIIRIQSECYSGPFIESADSFAAKLAARSHFSFMAMQGNQPVAYVVAMPWLCGDVPKLNGLAYDIPQNSDAVYIHDIAVSPVARNSGVARQLLETVLKAAESQGYKQAFLVVIHGAAPYWGRYGFDSVPVDAGLKQRLSAYGDGATYMVRPLIEA